MNAKERAQYQKLVLTPIPKLIPKLAIPTIISMMISMIYNVVDAYFVGKLGTSASAAIGILVSVQAVFQAIGFMCGHGSGSNISMKLGEGDHEAADRFLSTAFFLSLLLSTCLSVGILLFISPVMRLLGSTETILPYSTAYGVYILVSGPALAASCVLNNVMRYEGKAVFAMVGLVAGGVLNMIGDPIFMFGFHMGINGAGLSTALSQYISFFILLYMFVSGRTISKIHRVNLLACGSEVAGTFKNGLPSLVRQVLNSLSAMVLNTSAMPYGDAAIAAMAIVGRVVMLLGSAMIGIGQGYQPVAAYNYGALKYSRLRKGFFFTWGLGEVILSATALIGFLFPSQIISLFRDDPDVIRIGTVALRFQCVAIILQPWSVAANMMFQSIGHSKVASFLSSLRSGLYFIPLILILPHFIGIAGIESAQMAADILTTLTTIPFLLSFMRKLPAQDGITDADLQYQKTEQ